MSGVLVCVGWAAVAAGLVAIVVPNVLAFSWSIEAGLKFIDAFYPWPQNHSAFLRRPLQIRAHAALNGAALVWGLALLCPLLPPWADGFFSPLALDIYLGALVVGSVASVAFSATNAAHRLAGTLSFLFMALACVVPAASAWHALRWRGDEARARAHLVRSVAALFGAGVMFRVFAVTLMPLVPKTHSRECWLVLIWASWWIPAAAADALLLSPAAL
jgi:hypothetical protein